MAGFLLAALQGYLFDQATNILSPRSTYSVSSDRCDLFKSSSLSRPSGTALLRTEIAMLISQVQKGVIPLLRSPKVRALNIFQVYSGCPLAHVLRGRT
jgi:hypothetical protein